MTKNIGLWIDHRQAVIVTLNGSQEKLQRIESNAGKHIRYSGASHAQEPSVHDDTAEDKRDRRYSDYLDKYYDEVIGALSDADTIMIMGPGLAKTEFQKRLETHSLAKPIVAIEAADKLTDNQIVAEVKRHFHK